MTICNYFVFSEPYSSFYTEKEAIDLVLYLAVLGISQWFMTEISTQVHLMVLGRLLTFCSRHYFQHLKIPSAYLLSTYTALKLKGMVVISISSIFKKEQFSVLFYHLVIENI